MTSDREDRPVTAEWISSEDHVETAGVRRCRDAEHHADGTGYFDPNGHEITADHWHRALGMCVECGQKSCRCDPPSRPGGGEA